VENKGISSRQWVASKNDKQYGFTNGAGDVIIEKRLWKHDDLERDLPRIFCEFYGWRHDDAELKFRQKALQFRVSAKRGIEQ
jgi:hypothetical protein